MEDHRGREAVDEFGLKGFLDLFQHGFSGGDLTVEADGRLAGILCSGIGGHDEDHVSAVGFPSFVVSQYGVIHYLQQDVEYVGMGFLYLVEQ